MNALFKDFRIALRQHDRQRGFALTVMGTLALTIGASAAVFAVVNSVLVRALPFASPQRLVWIASVRPDNPNAPFSLPEFMDYQSQTRTLAGLVAYTSWSASLAGEGITERLTGARVSANAFDVLGLSPAAGRLLNAGDDRPEAPRVVVLSYRLWQQQYGGAVDVVGKTVRINRESFAIVGVLPAQFPLPLRDIDVVTPLAPDRDPLRHVRNSVNFLRVFGRLKAGTEAMEAEAELTTICGALRQRFPVEYARKERVRVDPFHDVLVGDFRKSLLFLLGAVMVVLATALTNLLSLALVRASGRRGELSVRTALGASRSQLARQLTVEAALLAMVGSSLGWLVATVIVDLALRWAPPSLPRLDEVSLDRTVGLFVMFLSVLVTALLAFAPLASIARAPTDHALRGASRGAIGDRWHHRIRNAMVVAEISAALVLMLATSVLVQDLLRLRDVPLGFNPDGVFQARLSVPPAYRSPDDVARFYERLADRLATAPGVNQLGVISVAPLSGLLATVPFAIAGQPATERERVSANLRVISPGYLATVGTRLLQGRFFSEADGSDSPAVALVSASLADRLLSGRAVARQLLIDDNNQGPRPIEIVGVIENVSHIALDRPPTLDIYVPLRQVHPDNVASIRDNQFWAIRIASDPATFRATFLAHVRALDPDAAVSGAGTMRQFVDAWLGPRRFNLGLFAAFASTALLLAVLGLYGLVSYTVSERASEIGLRMAIGATQGKVKRMILGEAARLGVAGVGLGLALAAAVRPLISSVIASTPVTTPTEDVWIDPPRAAAVAVLLIAVAVIAAWLPARRAARIEPTIALRAQ